MQAWVLHKTIMQYCLTFAKKITEQILITSLWAAQGVHKTPTQSSTGIQAVEIRHRSHTVIIIKKINKENVKGRGIYHRKQREHNTETHKSAISPQVEGDAMAIIWRPPMLQTHGATPWHCVRRQERRGKAFVSATWIRPRALWVITEKQGSSTNSASLEQTQWLRVDTEISSSLCVLINERLFLLSSIWI